MSAVVDKAIVILLDPRKRPPYRRKEMGLDYENAGNGVWGLFARVKYWAAKRSAREPGQRPDDLRKAAEMLRDSLEMAWRAGYKGEDLVMEMKKLTR